MLWQACGRFSPVLLVPLVALILSQPPVLAQFSSGSISATVTDKSGAVVPNAKIVLTNESSYATRETVTNGAGVFHFPSVPPASYTVAISAQGFQTWQQRNLVLTQGAIVFLPNVVLQVAGSKQEIQVLSGVESVAPVDSPQTSQTLSQNMVSELSIVGRDAAELIKIMPGMAMATGLGQTMWNSYVTATNTGPVGAFSANGTQPYGGMAMSSDGANLVDPGCWCSQTANINQNQVQEVSIQTSAYGAEYAKGPMSFQAIGKSGGAQFHGSGYLYARDGVFNSVDSYSKSQGGQPISDSFFYPGGDLGGPVLIPGLNFNRKRDKLFFYAAYEYMKQQPAGTLFSYFVPTNEMKAGNFSPEYIASLGPGFNNARSEGAVTPSEDEFPGGMIPGSQIDPVSLAYMSLFPKPNTDPVSNWTGSNYQLFIGPPQNRWEARIRGDYNISQNTKLFLSWNHQQEHSESPIGVWWNYPGSLPYPSKQVAIQLADVYSANLVHVFSPTLTNEFVFAQANFLNPIHLTDPDAVNPDKIPGFHFKGLFTNQFDPQIPNTFSGGNTSIGFATAAYGAPWAAGGPDSFGKLSQTPSISDNLTKVVGKHLLKAGVYWDCARNNQTGSDILYGDQGTLEFENWGARSTGNPLADWVTGRPTKFFQADGAPVLDLKHYQYSFFISDQWKASRRLTLTVGLRFEHMGNWVPASGPGLAVWDQSRYDNGPEAGAWTGVTWNERDRNVPMSGFPSRPLFYEPRFGAAYDLFGNGRTVLRGGWGRYRYQISYNDVAGIASLAPMNVTLAATEWGCCVGWESFSDYAPPLATPGIGSILYGILTIGDNRTPYTDTFNLTLSQRAPWHSVVEFQYSGNRSRDLKLYGGLSNINLVPLGAFFGPNPVDGKIYDPASDDFPAQDYRPLLNYQDVTLLGHGSYSNFNAFIATWQKQTGRFAFTLNYTFGKVLGIRDDWAGTALNPYSVAANYGVLGWDRTHIFNAAYVIQLPGIGAGSKFFKGALNGWTLSGITQLQSGAPIQPNTFGTLWAQWPGDFTGQRYLGTNAVAIFPKLTCDPRSGLASGQYFNPDCFAPPTGGKNGDVIWPYIHGPAYFNSDLAVYKNFKATERRQVQLRFSAFNFLNHPLAQFGTVAYTDTILAFINNDGTLSKTNANSSTSGKPLFTVGRRVIEFAVRYTF
jgi:hypothetical protein